MANEVSVESAAVQGGIGCCRTAIHALESASRGLEGGYRQAGAAGWRDQKYAALGSIVGECCAALTRPVGELEECLKKLEELLRAVREYEQTDL